MSYWGLDSNVFLNIRMNFSTYLSMRSDKSPSVSQGNILSLEYIIHPFFTFMNFSSSTTITFFKFLLFVTSTASSSALFFLSFKIHSKSHFSKDFDGAIYEMATMYSAAFGGAVAS